MFVPGTPGIGKSKLNSDTEKIVKQIFSGDKVMERYLSF
jgi:hypothetical protein